MATLFLTMHDLKPYQSPVTINMLAMAANGVKYDGFHDVEIVNEKIEIYKEHPKLSLKLFIGKAGTKKSIGHSLYFILFVT